MNPRVKRHVLTGYLKTSSQVKRWGTEGVSGSNIVRIAGLRVDSGSTPGNDAAQPKWALIVGDSITEGCGANELEGYSHLVGQAFRTLGYEYAVSACGWSGWLHRGDNPPGDVPGYYVVTNSVNGAGGQYFDALSRWNKIDSIHSLLDANGRISAYGAVGQEPAVILINYGTNDAIHPTNASDVQASMAQGLEALRKAAPHAHLFFIIPFGQYKAAEIRQTVSGYQSAHPDDRRVSIIDLGPEAARALTPPKGYWGGLHPNPRAHATFAAQIVAQVTAVLGQSASANR
jgi:lysophospholipase L1-like esterase